MIHFQILILLIEFVNSTCNNCLIGKKKLKLKLIKTLPEIKEKYLRVNELTTLSIEEELLKEIDFKNVINNFAFKKTRRIDSK